MLLLKDCCIQPFKNSCLSEWDGKLGLQSTGLERRPLVPLQSSQLLESPPWSVIKLELCAWACEPELGHSLAFCWDLIEASTHTRQMNNCIQKNAYFAYCVAYCSILFDLFCISCILQYAEYAWYEPCTIFLHIILHILHIDLHTAAYHLTILHIAICRICRIWTLHYFFAYYFAYFAYCFAYICNNMQDNMQTPKSICRIVQGSYFAYW